MSYSNLPYLSSGSTALLAALVMGHFKVVKILVENGADVNITNDVSTVSHRDIESTYTGVYLSVM